MYRTSGSKTGRKIPTPMPAEGCSELREVIEAWPHLPAAETAGILAMIRASSPGIWDFGQVLS
jgi:hypothetical protein